MKKLLITALSALFFAGMATAAELRIGVSGAYTMLTSDGTETVKSSGTKNSKSHDENVVVPSIFLEIAADNGVAIGIDHVPGEADLGSGTNTRTDTDTDDASDTAGDNKVSAELTGHTTIYVTVPVRDNGAYLKAGVANATIETKETLATGTTYGDEDVTGILIGAGVSREASNGLTSRIEATYTNYDEATFNGSADSDSVSNKIDGDVDALAIRFSLVKAF